MSDADRNMKKTIRGNGRRQKEKYFHLEKKKPQGKYMNKMKDVENRRHLTFILSCNTKGRKQ